MENPSAALASRTAAQYRFDAEPPPLQNLLIGSTKNLFCNDSCIASPRTRHVDFIQTMLKCLGGGNQTGNAEAANRLLTSAYAHAVLASVKIGFARRKPKRLTQMILTTSRGLMQQNARSKRPSYP